MKRSRRNMDKIVEAQIQVLTTTRAATATVPIISWPISTLPSPACTNFPSSAAIPISSPGSASSASNIPRPGIAPVTYTCSQSAAYCVT